MLYRSVGWRPCRHRAGLTLIELLVGVAIVGMMFAVATTGLRGVFNVDLKKSAARLGSTLRYLSNKAVTDHLYLRMVYDLDGQSYLVEESGNPFVVSSEEEEDKEEEKKKEEGESESGGEDGEEGGKEAESAFTQSESKLLSPTKLPSSVFFKDVAVSYLKGKREKGKAYTYFFPSGFATPTLINLRNEEDDEYFSVELFPLSGRVKIEGRYREELKEAGK